MLLFASSVCLETINLNRNAYSVLSTSDKHNFKIQDNAMWYLHSSIGGGEGGGKKGDIFTKKNPFNKMFWSKQTSSYGKKATSMRPFLKNGFKWKIWKVIRHDKEIH